MQNFFQTFLFIKILIYLLTPLLTCVTILALLKIHILQHNNIIITLAICKRSQGVDPKTTWKKSS